MAFVPVLDIGSVGVVKDIPAHRLVPEAWSDARNIRFYDNKAAKMLGSSPVFDPPSVAPYWAQHVVSPSGHAWMYANLTKVYAYVGGSHNDITRAVGGDYSTTANTLWNGGMLGGIPVINNSVDVPQYWAPIGGAQRLQDLTNWPANTTCKVLRPFKVFLMALNITKASGGFPHMVKWSHPADPGSVPSSWDETDPTKDAGERELVDAGAGVIIDGRVLRDMFVIFKENSVHGMIATGTASIFRDFGILQETGVPEPHLVTGAGKGDLLVFFTGEDLVVFDGQSARSVLDKKTLRWVRSSFSSDNINKSYVVANRRRDEVWLCIPISGATYPNVAVIWNYRENTITLRDLPGWSFIAPGVIEEAGAGSGSTWDTLTNVWDAAVGTWDPANIFATQYGLLGCDHTNTKLFRLDETNQENGSNMSAYLERTGLTLIGLDRNGQPASDLNQRKLVTRIRVRATGSPFNVRLGGQEEINGAIAWSAAETFTPGVSDILDIIAQGRLLSVRFESNTDVAWEIQDYELDIEPLGMF